MANSRVRDTDRILDVIEEAGGWNVGEHEDDGYLLSYQCSTGRECFDFSIDLTQDDTIDDFQDRLTEKYENLTNSEVSNEMPIDIQNSFAQSVEYALNKLDDLSKEKSKMIDDFELGR